MLYLELAPLNFDSITIGQTKLHVDLASIKQSRASYLSRDISVLQCHVGHLSDGHIYKPCGTKSVICHLYILSLQSQGLQPLLKEYSTCCSSIC